MECVVAFGQYFDLLFRLIPVKADHADCVLEILAKFINFCWKLLELDLLDIILSWNRCSFIINLNFYWKSVFHNS